MNALTRRAALRPFSVSVSVSASLAPLRSSSSASSSAAHPSASTPHDPLAPTVPTTPLGLPVTPFPGIAEIPSAAIDSALLRRLHVLAALDPPPEGSAEEQALLADLGELVGLMDLVGEVEVGHVGDLLSAGMGEVRFGPEMLEKRPQAGLEEGEGRDLLAYATRRVGDFYGFKSTKKGQNEDIAG